MKHSTLIISILILSALVGCRSTNVTPLRNDTTISSFQKEESDIWNAADDIEQRIEKKTGPFEGKEQTEQYLNEVIQKITQDFNNPEMSVRVSALLNPNPNAFVLPNGAAYVTSGLLALLENEAQLANILSHEFCHFKNRHSFRQSIKGENDSAVGFVFGLFIASLAGAATGTVDMGLSNSASQLWSIASGSGYSKELELEADRCGLIAMLKAGYSPDQSTKAFRLLLEASDETKKSTSWLSSHPELSQRIGSYEKCLHDPAIQEFFTGEFIGVNEYERAIFPMILENARINIEQNELETARKNIDRCLASKPNCAKAYFLLGELSRHGSGKNEKSMNKAFDHYEKALEIDPDYAKCYREIGLLYRYLGNLDSSRKYLSKYIELAPEEIDVPIIRSYLE